MFGGLENNLYICCEILTVANDVVEEWDNLSEDEKVEQKV